MNPSFKDVFAQAVAMFNRKRYPEVTEQCSSLLKMFPENAEVLHLMGMAFKELKQLEKAEQLLHQSLQKQPLQPVVMSNLANILKALNKTDQAIAYYYRAIELDPRLTQAWSNLALTLYGSKRLKEAADVVTELLQRSPGSMEGWELSALIHWKQKDFVKARSAFDRAMTLAPTNARVHYNAGNFYRECFELDIAIAAYEKAYALGLRMPELFVSLAGAYYDSGDIASAEQSFDRGVENHPDHSQILYSRAKFLWESRGGDDSARDLAEALARHPGDEMLWASYFDWFSHQGQFEHILEKVPEAKRYCVWSPRLQFAEAVAHSAVRHDEQASRLFEALLAIDPEGIEPNLAFAEHLLKINEPERAADLCSSVLVKEPFNQRALAFLGTSWQLMSDARAEWLLDYSSMVCAREIPVPAGWGSLESFLSDVRRELDALHLMKKHPLEQTVRQGTQTSGFLFRGHNPVLKALQQSLEATCNDTIQQFPDTRDHPFWKRKSNKVRMQGAWSVRLNQSGFHTNHFHPEGWISSAFYVAVPDVCQTTETCAGYIQFGAPPVELNLAIEPKLKVRPEAGKLLLFPSYMWHGTVPFVSTQPRMTVAFDLVPC